MTGATGALGRSPSTVLFSSALQRETSDTFAEPDVHSTTSSSSMVDYCTIQYHSASLPSFPRVTAMLPPNLNSRGCDRELFCVPDDKRAEDNQSM